MLECIKKGICKFESNSGKTNYLQAFDCHHIVPKAPSDDLVAAQTALSDVGINRYTDPRNLITLTRGFHIFIRSGSYNKVVNEAVGDAYDASPTLAGVEGALSALKVLLTDSDNVVRMSAELPPISLADRSCTSNVKGP